MKKLLLFTVLLIASMGLKAQESHYGAKLGMSYSSFNMSGDDDAINMQKYSKGKPNLSIGLMGEFLLSDQFAIAPELNYAGSGDVFELDDNKITYFLSYLNIPVMGRYYISENFSLEAGPELGVLLSAEGEVSVNGNTVSTDIKKYLNTTNFSLGLGAGYKLNNGLFFNARYNLGLSNVNKVTEDDKTVLNINAFEFGIGYFIN